LRKIFLRFFSQGRKIHIKTKTVIILLAVNIFVSILLGEILVRTLFYLPVEKEYLRFQCFGYKKIPGKKVDPDLLWKPSEEFRNVQYSLKKPKNTFRIICNGHSVIQGAGKKGLLPREQTFVYKLEQILSQKYKNKKIEVINAGNGGYSSLQGLRYLRKKLWKYNPDLIINWFGGNEYYFALFYSDKEQKADKENKKTSAGIFEKSKLYLLFKNLSFIRKSLKNPVVRVLPEDFYKNCEKMLIFGREKGIKSVFVVPFHADFTDNNNWIKYSKESREELEELKKKYGCELLYLKPYLTGMDLKTNFVDTFHFSNEGSQIVAQAIFELLEKKLDGWINQSS